MCDGITRRNFLRVGALALGGLTLPDLLRSAAQAAEQRQPRRKSVILIWLAGGPSHIDMYDLKPNAPAEFRGEFKPIATNVPGIEISEHLPLQAQDHGQAGDRPLGVPHQRRARHGLAVDADRLSADHRSQRQHLSVVRLAWSRKLNGANEPGLPAYVNLPRQVSFGKAAYLGASYNPFSPDSDPEQRRLPGPQPEAAGPRRRDRLDRRRELAGAARHDPPRHRHQGRHRRARHVLPRRVGDGHQRQGPAGVRHSTRKTAKLRDHYGRNDLGQSCLLARRLVEAGVTFVTVQAGGGWDTHGDNFTQLKNNLLPKYDRAVAALVEDLARPRPGRRRAGDGDGRVRPHAADQPGRRPRSLARRDVGTVTPAAA